MIEDGYRLSKINKTQIKNLAELGIFSLGLSYLLYFFIQYFLAPLCWWLTQDIESLGWMNDVFYLFERQELEVYTIQSLYYSSLAIIAFIAGYYFLPAKLVIIKHELTVRKWNSGRAEKIFWLLLFSGYTLKTIKVIAGVSITDLVDAHIKHGLFSNPLISFYLSFNWLHLVALIVINVAYQEAKRESHSVANRLKLIAYSYGFFYLVATFTTGAKNATLFPLIGLLIIKLYYAMTPISPLKMVLPFSILAVTILVTKNILSGFFEAVGYDPEENSGIRFELFYVLFHRINMSHVVAAVIEKGRLAYSGGTLKQFFVEMTPYGLDRENVFDGNKFGHAVGIASPNDNVTGFASTNIGELFINFGLFGIIFGMVVTGILYKILFANCKLRTPMFVMLYALMWPILIHGMESPITVLYATSIKMISLCLIVHIAITYKFSRVSIQKIISSKDMKA